VFLGSRRTAGWQTSVRRRQLFFVRANTVISRVDYFLVFLLALLMSGRVLTPCRQSEKRMSPWSDQHL
jgi:hypothetical protein